MTGTSDEDSKINKLFLSSIAVGAVGVGLATIYLVDGSPNDSNVGFWLYTPISMFFLVPCQIALAVKLYALNFSIIKYLGVMLTLVSLIMTIGIW
ncbi:MAG: hypothetical protein K0U72_02990 [Gammaproteobacteria bacterium]|nr:hypothetical protein [Gammaproteobacteria bacterium]